MILPKFTLLLGLILTLLLDPISGKRGFSSHSYPKSGGLSGGGHRSGGLSGGGHGYPSSGGSHGYPSSGGSHGYPSSGGSHGYPSSGSGLSGGGHGYPSGGSHGYPSSGNSGGSHAYPPSGGYPSSGVNRYPSSGSNAYPSSGGSHGYPAANKPHTYPTNNNNHGYPASPGLSGGGRGYPANKPTHTTHHTTKVYNHYHYSPPPQISYSPVRGAPPVSYPVYHGTPPTYVYQYKDSGSKYGTLLAGLALMNLGTLGVAGYAAYKANQNHGGSSPTYTYTPQKGEVCKFAVRKENGDYEETRIDCQIISGFILQDMEAQRSRNQSTITTTTTVTNVTMFNTTNVGPGGEAPPIASIPNVLYQMLPNGTLVPVNTTGMSIPGMPGVVSVNDTANGLNNMSSSVVVTTTTTNSTLVSALDVKGKPVEVTPGMQCFVIRHSPTSNMRKTVPCGLLQTYADTSIRRNYAVRTVPMFTAVAAILVYCIA